MQGSTKLPAERPCCAHTGNNRNVSLLRCKGGHTRAVSWAPTRGMARGKAAKKTDGGRGRAPKRSEPEPPSAEAQAALADAEAKQAQLAEELRTVEQQARRA